MRYETRKTKFLIELDLGLKRNREMLDRAIKQYKNESTMQNNTKNLREHLVTMLAVETLEYHDKNLLAGDECSRSEERQAKFKACLNLVSRIEAAFTEYEAKIPERIFTDAQVIDLIRHFREGYKQIRPEMTDQYLLNGWIANQRIDPLTRYQNPEPTGRVLAEETVGDYIIHSLKPTPETDTTGNTLGRWIKCKDELPPYGLLVYTKSETGLVGAYSLFEQGWNSMISTDNEDIVEWFKQKWTPLK